MPPYPQSLNPPNFHPPQGMVGEYVSALHSNIAAASQPGSNPSEFNTTQDRPLIDLNDDLKITHRGVQTRVSMTTEIISVGCSDISIKAAYHLIAKWESLFAKPTIVQPEIKP